MTREQGLELLKQYVETDRVMRHSLAVEAAMRAYAKKFDEDVERWGLLGLLHDIDFEKYPEVHPKQAPELLKDFTDDQSFVDTILSHGDDMDIPRDTNEKKCLHAVDEMASFIIAIALMRPTRLEGLKGKSVKKKMKDKAFAKAVNRAELTSSREELGIEFNEHIDIIVSGLVEHENYLNESGITMLN